MIYLQNDNERVFLKKHEIKKSLLVITFLMGYRNLLHQKGR